MHILKSQAKIFVQLSNSKNGKNQKSVKFNHHARKTAPDHEIIKKKGDFFHQKKLPKTAPDDQETQFLPTFFCTRPTPHKK